MRVIFHLRKFYRPSCCKRNWKFVHIKLIPYFPVYKMHFFTLKFILKMGCILYNEGKNYFLFSKVYILPFMFQDLCSRWMTHASWCLTFTWLLAHVCLRTGSPNASCVISYPSNQLQTFIELRCCNSLWQWHGFCRLLKGQFTI